LNKSADCGQLCLFPDFRGHAFRFFPIYYDAGYRFVVDSLYTGMLSTYILFLVVHRFCHEWVLDFVKGLFCIY
jgi:hypothetical protein